MPSPAQVQTLAEAYRVIKGMRPRGWEWGEDPREAARAALVRVLEERMACHLDERLAEVGDGEADRRNGSWTRHVLTELGDVVARYAGRRDKAFTTALGEMTLSRAHYHCESCEAGFFPRDCGLGVEDTSLSPAVTRMTGKTAAMVSFAESSESLRDLAGVSVDAKQVERTAEALGREIAQDERTMVEPEPPSAPTMYLPQASRPLRGLLGATVSHGFRNRPPRPSQ